MKYYVYLLKDQGVPFYVGKGTKGRMYEHAYFARIKKRNSAVLNKIRKIWREGRSIEYELVFWTDDTDAAYNKEMELISSIGRRDQGKGTLMNLTDGGEGVRGYVITESHRKNLSVAIKKAILEGRWLEHASFARDDDYRKKISQSHQTRWTPEERSKFGVKMRERLKDGKRVLSEEARKRMSDAAKRGNAERSGNPDVAARISKSVKLSWANRRSVS